MTKQLNRSEPPPRPLRRPEPPFIPAPFRSPHLAVKLFFAPGSRVNLALGAKAFERWLRERALAAGQLIEVITRASNDGGPVGDAARRAHDVAHRREERSSGPRLHAARAAAAMKTARDVLFTAVVLSSWRWKPWRPARRPLRGGDGPRPLRRGVPTSSSSSTPIARSPTTSCARRRAVERELGLFALELFEGPELETTHPAPQLFRIVIYPGRRRTLGELIARMHAVA